MYVNQTTSPSLIQTPDSYTKSKIIYIYITERDLENNFLIFPYILFYVK